MKSVPKIVKGMVTTSVPMATDNAKIHRIQKALCSVKIHLFLAASVRNINAKPHLMCVLHGTLT